MQALSPGLQHARTVAWAACMCRFEEEAAHEEEDDDQLPEHHDCRSGASRAERRRFRAMLQATEDALAGEPWAAVCGVHELVAACC